MNLAGLVVVNACKKVKNAEFVQCIFTKETIPSYGLTIQILIQIVQHAELRSSVKDTINQLNYLTSDQEITEALVKIWQIIIM